MIEKLKKVYLKYRQLIVYLINGGFTTLVNFVVYILMTNIFNVEVLTANTIAWCIAVIYAFITNKVMVFHDKQHILKQFIMFAGLRSISYLIEEASLYLFVVRIGFNDLLIKIIVAIVVVVTNYIFSKFIIFKK